MSADVVADLNTAVVSFRSAGGDEVSSKPQIAMPALFDAKPWRTFRWYKRQRNYSGQYWSATERCHVVYESRNELAALLLADFDVAVHRIVAQPLSRGDDGSTPARGCLRILKFSHHRWGLQHASRATRYGRVWGTVDSGLARELDQRDGCRSRPLPDWSLVMDRDVHGFLHVCCLGAYREVTWEIVHALLESRLYDRSIAIELGVLGDDAQQQVIETLIRPFERFRIGFRSSDLGEYEFPTLALLQHACHTWTGPVYYLHTKGVTRSPYDLHARCWRQLMLDEVVTNHERCLAELTAADAVGTNWRWDHYSGNFWWARASHIRRLPDIRGLQRFPRQIKANPVSNKRVQCEFWIGMTQGRFAGVGYSGLNLSQELRWTTSAADIINDLLTAGAGRRFVELSMDRPSRYFAAVVANSKVSVSYRSRARGCSEQDFLAADPPDGGCDVIFIDTWHEPTHSLHVIERCLPKLSADGVLVVHDTNPPTAWHQRPAEEYERGSAWNGQVWRAIAEFRIRHPQCEVFTVDTDWGCTIIRPSRRARQGPGAASADGLDWAAFERERSKLLNLVNVAWFRRHLYADPYLAGSASLVSRTEVLNVLISMNALDSYLEIGVGAGNNLAQIIAPIRQSVDPYADATYQMTSDEFFAHGLGLDRYDLIFVDGLHEEDQCRRDLEHALSRLSDRGWIVAHDANPPTEWHQRPVEQFEPGSNWNGTVWKALIRFRSEHPELELCTLDLDWGCALLRRRAANVRLDPVPALPYTLDWAFFAKHRRKLLNLVSASTEELRNLLC